MHRAGKGLRSLAGLTLAVAVLAAFGFVSGARAQEDNNLASITLYAFICPGNYAGDDFFNDCSGTPGENITFRLDGTASAPTNAAGFTAFEGLDQEGEYLLQIDVPGEFTDFVAFCSDEFGDPFPFTSAADVGGIVLDLTLDDDIRCDFYVIPIPQNGNTPVPTVAPTAVPTRAPAQPTQRPATSTVATLPSTGTGPSDGGDTLLWSLAGALALVAVAGFALGHARIARAGARTRQ